MHYYFPYIRTGDKFVRLGWYLEEVGAEHVMKRALFKQYGSHNVLRLSGTDKTDFRASGILAGFIKKETVKECRVMKRTNSLNYQK